MFNVGDEVSYVGATEIKLKGRVLIVRSSRPSEQCRGGGHCQLEGESVVVAWGNLRPVKFSLENK